MTQRAQRQIERFFERLATPQTAGFDALLGDGQGNVEVSGQADRWYVRPLGSDLPIIVKRGASPKIEGIHVRVQPEFGSDKRRRKRGMMRVMGVLASSASSNAQLEPHGGTHLAGQSDPIYIDGRQIINAIVYAASGLTVNINPGWAIIDRKPVHWEFSTLSLSGNVPASGALYGLVRVDGDGVIDLQEGDAAETFLDLTWDDVPQIENGYAALAVVRLYMDQTALSRLYSNPDVYDIRFAPVSAIDAAEDAATAMVVDPNGSVVTYAGEVVLF